MANVLLRASGLLVAAFALAFLYVRMPESGARVDKAPCERCNVILISFDTVRADHLGAYGYERPTTPNVDALAAKSAVFERAISQAPWTLPAHGAMLSGLYPSRLGVLRYPATRVLSDQNTVLPEVFKAAGYATAGFTGGGFVSDHYGFNRGFDVYSSRGRRYEHNLDDTLDWLSTHKDKPFFLFFHGYDAHRPYYSKPVDKAAMGLPEDSANDQSHFCLQDSRERPDDAGLDRILRYYDAAIHHGDRGIGILLDTLQKQGLMENTVILLTSDHGEEFFEHGNCDHVRFVYDESVHVPLMVYVPKMTPSGKRIDGLVPASISVSRTLLDLVGIDHAMPGVSLLSILEGKQKNFPVVYSEADTAAGSFGSRGPVSAMTKADQRLISYTEEGVDEAYNTKADPGEHDILPESSPAYQMRQSLRAWRASLKPLPRPEVSPDEAAAALADDESGASDPEAGEDSGDDGDQGSGKGGAKPSKGQKMPEQLKKDLRSLGYLQ